MDTAQIVVALAVFGLVTVFGVFRESGRRHRKSAAAAERKRKLQIEKRKADLRDPVPKDTDPPDTL